MGTLLLANNATCTTIHGVYCSGWQEMTSLDITFATIALPPNVARRVCLPATQQLEANVTHHHHQQPNAASQREIHGTHDDGCLLEHIALKDCTHLRATFVRHQSRKLPAYANIVCDVCMQGDLTVSHATSQRWSNLAKLVSALPPGMHKTTPSPSDAFFDLQKASFT